MLVSTTLTGGNTDIIGDALRSIVDHVDACLVIDTRSAKPAHPADPLMSEIFHAVGVKGRVTSFDWTGSFSDARNFALQYAAESKADWAITVDTDERMVIPPGFDLCKALESTSADVLLVNHTDGTYGKERIVRLPTECRWYGPTHEALGGQLPGKTGTLQGMSFWELQKTPEQYKAKFERDIAVLKEYTEKKPDETRWWYYLGASYQDTGKYEEAAYAFERCYVLRGWEEECAWACYRAAQCYCALNNYKRAVSMCVNGMQVLPQCAELAWLAAWAEYTQGHFEKAVAWANMSIANGAYSGAGKRFKRIGFKDPLALHDGPFDVLYWAYSKLGNESAAQLALVQRDAAKRKRESAR